MKKFMHGTTSQLIDSIGSKLEELGDNSANPEYVSSAITVSSVDKYAEALRSAITEEIEDTGCKVSIRDEADSMIIQVVCDEGVVKEYNVPHADLKGDLAHIYKDAKYCIDFILDDLESRDDDALGSPDFEVGEDEDLNEVDDTQDDGTDSGYDALDSDLDATLSDDEDDTAASKADEGDQ